MGDQVIHTRRRFMQTGLTLLSTTATVPFFLDRTALAVSNSQSRSRRKSKRHAGDNRVLVVLQLAGGNDGLNTVIPYRNDRYYQARPKIGIDPKQVLGITDTIGLHPQAEGLKQLYDDGLLAVIQGVGYPNPNRSHFIATDIWSLGDPGQRMHNGWIGRYFDNTCKGNDRPSPRRAIALTSETPLAMTGDCFRPVCFRDPDQLSWQQEAATDSDLRAFRKLNTPSRSEASSRGDSPNEGGMLSYLKRTALDAFATAGDIQDAIGSSTKGHRRHQHARRRPRGRSADGIDQQLQMVKRMIASGMETQVYYVSMGGFDTHAGQEGRHRNLLKELGAALANFFNALRKDHLLDRVVLMTFSEFGRRVAENGSRGTDHGAAAPLFVVGNTIRPGLHGEHPSLEPDELDHGDLRWKIDFRSVYSAILSDWLKADPVKILGGRFKMPKLFKS